MKKTQEKKVKKLVRKERATRSAGKREKDKTVDAGELFGVHIISEKDIETHLGPADKKPTGKNQGG